MSHFGPQKIILLAPKTALEAQGVDLSTQFVILGVLQKSLIFYAALEAQKIEKLAQDAAKRLQRIPGTWAAPLFLGIWAPGAARARLCTRY